MLNKNGHWSPDDIAWEQFDPSRVDSDILAVIRAASLVERNSADYVAYLKRVISDDPEFRAAAEQWGHEEHQHGIVLGRWAEMADPDFDFETAFRRFTEGYRIPVDAEASVRGSRAGEMVARCVVEAGTSSFYAALRDATEEPVLKDICNRISKDEIRHYRMFQDYFQRYQEREHLGRPRRAWIAATRFLEAEDDELSFAYYCANMPPEEAYDRSEAGRAYARTALGCYRRDHLGKAVKLILKAAGLPPHGRLGDLAFQATWLFLKVRTRGQLAA
ncbi:ferritin-like domain-containing protein [Minwuia thermotolerans]|uniref:Rubrerythrin family protein n=1 Tax=Minwuia thermotolerans TaxID=2056226 RepID=A0A2M9G699_9PROT|nr:ferritin-like domain-containing protein [Minwuia thermotolerans]PJK31245.1 rubrerythrin family protein [Minwuia thermotolerans]